MLKKNSIDYMTAYYNKNSTLETGYNYDLAPLLYKFNFYDFVSYAEQGKVGDNDYGGFLVITPKQYIIGYNSGFGTGTHLSSFARTMMDLKGGGPIFDNFQATDLAVECDDNYLTAVIIYEKVSIQGKPVFKGFISFDLTKKVSENEYRVFEKFCDDYKEDISYVIKKFKNFSIIYQYRDNNGKKRTESTTDLELIKQIVRNNIDYNKEENNINEHIIGVEVKSKML